MILYVRYLPQEYQDEIREIISKELNETAKVFPIDCDSLLEEAMNSKLSDLTHILGIDKITEYRKIITSQLS